MFDLVQCEVLWRDLQGLVRRGDDHDVIEGVDEIIARLVRASDWPGTVKPAWKVLTRARLLRALVLHGTSVGLVAAIQGRGARKVPLTHEEHPGLVDAFLASASRAGDVAVPVRDAWQSWSDSLVDPMEVPAA